MDNQAYLYKGYLGIDEKHKISSATNHGRNQVLNSVTVNEYQQILNMLSDTLISKNLMTNDIRAALDDIKEIVSQKDFDFDKLLDTWSKYIHFFPPNWKPPLMIEKTFDETHLTEKAIEKLRKGELILQRISDKLYQLKVLADKIQFSEKALYYYHDFFIQELHGIAEY